MEPDGLRIPAPAGRSFEVIPPSNLRLSLVLPFLEVSSTHLRKASIVISRGVESLFGTRDENIRLLESALGIYTQLVDNTLEIEGDEAGVLRAESILQDYNALVREGHIFNNGDLNSCLRIVTGD